MEFILQLKNIDVLFVEYIMKKHINCTVTNINDANTPANIFFLNIFLPVLDVY